MNLNESLFSSYKISKSIELKNRILMAPMTRRFADNELCPIPEMADYYTKRSDAGLIVTEGTIISPDATGYGNVPGIYTEKQIAKWSKVTEKVHQNNGKIFLQLWHCGRVSHPKFHNGNLPISCSETEMLLPLGKSGLMPGKSRAASLSEIEKLINDYSLAAKNAIKAGFDGVELHGANGYLIDQFLHHCTNLRDDIYGKTPENMSRFCVEVVQACSHEIGNDKVALRISPGGYTTEMKTHPNDKFIFDILLKKISELNIAYVHIGNSDDSVIYPELENKTMTQFVRDHYIGNLVACGSYSVEKAHEGILSNQFNLIAMGRNFISNPDLIDKIKSGKDLIKYDVEMLRSLN